MTHDMTPYWTRRYVSRIRANTYNKKLISVCLLGSSPAAVEYELEFRSFIEKRVIETRLTHLAYLEDVPSKLKKHRKYIIKRNA